MFSFLKRKPAATVATFSLEPFQADWHCHILPGIDDGAPHENESLAMLDLYVKYGIKKIIATPHVRNDFFKNDTKTINESLQKLQNIIKEKKIPITLEASAEYFADEYFLSLVTNNDLLPIESQYILFELPMQQPTLIGMQLVELIQKQGYTPVLAHPERYRYWHGDKRKYIEWKERGVYFQLNLLSLAGYYGSAERIIAEYLVKSDLIDAVGTDAHGVRHLHKLQQLNENPSFQLLQQLPLLNILEQ